MLRRQVMNLHANAVRVMQYTDPSLPRTPEGELPEAALTPELKSLKDFIKKNPSFVYNSAGGKPTGWKGMREHFTVKRGGKYRYKGPR